MQVDEILKSLHGVVVDYSFADPVDNLCYDDVLLQYAETGRISCALRFWESSTPFVVLGRSGKIEEDLCAAPVLEAGVPVYRRGSGGGTVVQGPGCLNYALVIPKQKSWTDVRASYAAISSWLLDALATCGMKGSYEPISDLAIDGRKFSGNAQRRGRSHILQHGTILYDFDLKCISDWLRQPQAQPPYRADRSHADFVTNIAVSASDFKAALQRVFATPYYQDPLPGSVAELARQRAWGRVQTLSLCGVPKTDR